MLMGLEQDPIIKGTVRVILFKEFSNLINHGSFKPLSTFKD